MHNRIGIRDAFKARILSMGWRKDLGTHEIEACALIKFIY